MQLKNLFTQHTKNNKFKSIMQIQPNYDSREEYLELAIKESLDFEIIELSSKYVNKEIPREVIEWYKKSCRAKSLHGVFMDIYPVSNDEDIKKVSRNKCELSCRLAKELGAENIVFHSTALTFCRASLEISWGKAAAEYYQELAEKQGINIFIENFSDIDYIPMKHMMDNVNSDKVGICLDVGHSNFSRCTLEQWIEGLGDYIKYIHISDNNGLWDDHLALGEGTVELHRISEFWENKGRSLPVTLEVGGFNSIKKSLDYLKRNELFGFSQS